jgi:DNA-binding response OmpR family regulator
MTARARVLYLEDDETLGALTREMLEQAGFSVEWLRNGEVGLQRVRAESFDICVVDIMMPRLDGYSFVKTLRDASSDLPVVFLSARVLTDDILKGFEIGGDDYMRKPFSVEELVARMRRLLGQRSKQEPELKLIPVGRYNFHYNLLELRLDGVVTQLSPRSAELLYRIATNRDRILPKRETLLELWGDDSFFNGRSLDVFISKLRKQLGGDPGIRIVNIRSIGYKLIVDD